MVAAAALAAAGMYPVVFTGWFSQTFAGLADGLAFTGNTGSSGGHWSAPIPEGAATVATVGGRKCIQVNTDNSDEGSIQFDADDINKVVRIVDFSISTYPLPGCPSLQKGDLAALCLLSTNQIGVRTFGGYTRDGWKELFGRGLAEHSHEWLDCRAAFEYVTNAVGLVADAYVTYYAASSAGDAYLPLTDADGVSRFRAVTNEVRAIAFSGEGLVGDFRGFGAEADTSRVYTWNGASGGAWDDPDNWNGGKGGAPGDGDLARVPNSKDIRYGKYLIQVRKACSLSIVSNASVRIGPSDDGVGNVKIFCDDGDYTALGTVYVDAGSTLQACGTYAGVEMAYGSTLATDASVGLTVTDRTLFLDGVTLDVSDMPFGAEQAEGVLAVTAPYGSGGVLAKLLRNGAEMSDWAVAWHDQLDGRADLWLVNGNYSGKVAIWNGSKNSELADPSNWSPEPGSSVAALIGSGATQMSGSKSQVFEFARWFDVGHSGECEVAIHRGDFTIRGNADKGGAVLVGSDGGTAVLDVVGGLVRPYDYLWNCALTLGSGTNAMGQVMVRGGAVDAAGGSVSVGADSSASMMIEKGRVSVGGSLGIGHFGALGLSGGALAVSNSLYVGRAARTEAYDVKMTVSDGVVSNLAAGAILIGSHGGLGSKATFELDGGEVYATNRFVCGGYRSACVNVRGGVLVSPEICIGQDLVDEEDVASFNLVSGCVETAGFTSGTNGVRNLSLVGGELVATAANDDFFSGLDLVRLDGDTVLSSVGDIVINAALTGPADLVKAGPGSVTVAGYAAWAGRTVVAEGVLDMCGSMVMGELDVWDGASVINAKYDEVDEMFPFLQPEVWTSGMASMRSFVYVDFKMAAGGGTVAEALDDMGVRKGAVSSILDEKTGARAFLGWTALGWTKLDFPDETTVGTNAYDLRMLFDFREGKPYVAYYANSGSGWERLINADGLTAFPVAGAAARNIKTFLGVSEYVGRQLYADAGRVLYWIGPDGGEWNDGNNWSDTPCGSASGKYPDAIGDDGSLAFVERPASISVNSAAKTAVLMVNDNVRLSGARALTVSSTISGSGRLTLSNATLHAAAMGVPVNVPVVAVARTSNQFLSTPQNCTFVLNGPLRGTGEIALTALNRRPMGGTVLAGDNSEFGGTVKIYPWASKTDEQKLDKPSIATPQASSAIAQWEINVEHDYAADLKPGMDFFGTAYAVYCFGSLKANFYSTDALNAYWAKDGVTLEVGPLDRDSYAFGACVAKDGAIDWVASTATFTNGVSGLSSLRLRGGGKIVIAKEDALPSDSITFADKGGELVCDVNTDLSVLISNSTAPVVFNGGDGWCEWAGAPGASNVGGFVKRGMGTLVWYDVPSFRIDVTVEEGTLIVPFGTQLGRVSVSRGATLAVDCSEPVKDALVFSSSSSAYRLRDPELSFLNVPDGYEITITYGDDNAIVAANGGFQFDWSNATGNSLWATPGNWLVDTSVPSRYPKNLDRVWYGVGTSETSFDRPAAAMSLRSLGNVAFAGSFALDVLLQFSIDGVLDLSPNLMTADSSSADYYGAGTNVLGVSSVAAFSARTVRGEGFVSTGGKDLVVSPSGSGKDRFVGTLSAGSFVKKGDGTFEFIGDGAFFGGVKIEQGTLRLGSYRDIDGIRTDFDASDEDGLELQDGCVRSWTSRVGAHVLEYSAGQQAVPTDAFFGGRRAIMLRPDAQGQSYSKYALLPANAPGDVSRSLFVVYVSKGVDGCIYAQSGDVNRGLTRDVDLVGGPWYCPVDGFGTRGIFTGVEYGSDAVLDGVPALTFWSDTALSDVTGTVESLGTAGTRSGFRGAVGEIVAFSRTLTHVERDVTSRMLMNKWGVSGCAEFAPIHTNTPVTMCAGATLDLGGQMVTVGSFTGAGTVTNGVFVTADGKITQSGGALSVSAVEGVTYVASSAGQKLVIRDAPGITVRIVLPKGWFSAGNTGRRAIFCESNRIEWDIWRKDVRPISEGDGWWSISGGGFAIRLR